LYFDGSVCDDGQGIGVVLISPNGAMFDLSNHVDEDRTNNQVKYEALLFSLEVLQSLGVKHVEAFGDSLLVVQQVSKVCQCYNGFLNAYLDKCLDIISCFDEFVIRHIQREDNGRANALAQEASGYVVVKKYFLIREPMSIDAEVQVLDEPARPVDAIDLTAQTGLTDVSTESNDSAKKVDKTVNVAEPT
jgi:ribonuclease HI